MRGMTARVATTAAVAIAALAASAGPAAAAQKPTPNGLCGAKNMMNANAAPHMTEAMAEHTHENGDRGMAGAVSRSGC